MSEKLIAKDFLEHNPTMLDIFVQWGKVNEAVTRFENKSTPSVFDFLFGSDGSRLWEHYVIDCHRKFYVFKTYLTREQYNDLCVNIYYNDTLYAY